MTAPLVYTYYAPIGPKEQRAEQEELIELWSDTWAEQGWVPCVMDPFTIRKGDDLTLMLRAIARLPTANVREYEDACYLRHLLMAKTGGGLLTDYDVMNVDFVPFTKMSDPLVILEPTRVPCAVWGENGDAYHDLCRKIVTYRPEAGEDHVSDMTIFRKTDLPTASVCIEHGCSGEPIRDHEGDGWRNAQLIHFSTASLRRRRFPGSKAKFILQEMGSLK